MNTNRSYAWRSLFILGGVLILIGGPQHPRGTMAQMLVDPAWFRSHALLFGGFLAWTIGLWLLHHARPALALLDRWLRIGVAATALQAFEMAVHTMAYMDAEALVAGTATPVLTAHLWLSVLIYPAFGAAMIGLIWKGQRQRALGSPWIGWLGILGAAAHGASAPLVIAFNVGAARILFPMLMLLALWFVLAGVWPTRASAPPDSPNGEAAAPKPSRSASAKPA